MGFRYRVSLVLTSLALCAALLGTAHHSGQPAHRNALQPAASDLYSRRALRRARTILQFKLLELREQRLDLILRALERHIPIDVLLKDL